MANDGTLVKKLDILGTKYNISISTAEKDSRLRDADGICDKYSKEIVLADLTRERNEPNACKKFDEYINKVWRHEIIHAYFFESGLDVESPYAPNEELIDWLAIQLPKIVNTCKIVGAI